MTPPAPRNPFSWRRVRAIARKELWQFLRDPRLLPLVFFAPVFELTLFGYAATMDVKNVRIAVVDHDRTEASRSLVGALTASGIFRVADRPASGSGIERGLLIGSVAAGVEIPAGYGGDLQRGSSASVAIWVDGANANYASIVQAYMEQIVAREGLKRVTLAVRRGPPLRLPTIGAEVRVWYNPSLESVQFMVPGVLCLVLLLDTMILTAMAIVKERERGTFAQLVVTPIRPTELMIGKLLPFAVIGMIVMTLVLAVADFWFGVRFAGSALLLYVLTGLFLFTTLGLGLWVSTVSRTQQQAMMTAFLVMFPTMMLAGVFYPIDNMPEPVQWLTYAIPMRYYITIVRGILLKGAGLSTLWPEALGLAVFGAAIFTLSVARFRGTTE